VADAQERAYSYSLGGIYPGTGWLNQVVKADGCRVRNCMVEVAEVTRSAISCANGNKSMRRVYIGHSLLPQFAKPSNGARRWELILVLQTYLIFTFRPQMESVYCRSVVTWRSPQLVQSSFQLLPNLSQVFIPTK